MKKLTTKSSNLNLIILNATSEFRHHNIIIYILKNKYSFWGLLMITFNSVILADTINEIN